MKRTTGLKRVTKAVRGKRGTVQRSYWVKSSAKAKQPKIRRSAMKDAFKLGVVSGAAQYGMHALTNKHHLKLGAAATVGSHVALRAHLQKKYGNPKSPLYLAGQHVMHAAGRTIGGAAAAMAHYGITGALIAHDIRRARRQAAAQDDWSVIENNAHNLRNKARSL